MGFMSYLLQGRLVLGNTEGQAPGTSKAAKGLFASCAPDANQGLDREVFLFWGFSPFRGFRGYGPCLPPFMHPEPLFGKGSDMLFDSLSVECRHCLDSLCSFSGYESGIQRRTETQHIAVIFPDKEDGPDFGFSPQGEQCRANIDRSLLAEKRQEDGFAPVAIVVDEKARHAVVLQSPQHLACGIAMFDDLSPPGAAKAHDEGVECGIALPPDDHNPRTGCIKLPEEPREELPCTEMGGHADDGPVAAQQGIEEIWLCDMQSPSSVLEPEAMDVQDFEKRAGIVSEAGAGELFSPVGGHPEPFDDGLCRILPSPGHGVPHEVAHPVSESGKPFEACLAGE